MILRRLYLYIVGAAALATLAFGLSLLGATVLLFIFNDPSAQDRRTALAGFTAMTLVALPVWAVHLGFANRFARRDAAERASAIRRLYVYWACLAASIAAMFTLSFTIGHLLRPLIDICPNINPGLGTLDVGAGCSGSPEWLVITQGAWATLVLIGIWAFHFAIATHDRAAVGEQGASATLRRWYLYPALLVGLLTMLAGAQGLIGDAWQKAAGALSYYQVIGDVGGQFFAGLTLWGVHARIVAGRDVEEDRKSTLRALEGFIGVAVCMIVALFGASQILYYGLARLLGVSNPGNIGTDFLTALAQPASALVVYGVAWFLIRRRLSRDTGSHEVDRQAGVRRLYTNLAALVSMVALAVGAAGVLWNLAEQIEAPIIGVLAGDWKDPISLSVTLLVVGLAVWLAHWRHAPWPGDRQSLSRRLYVWAALLASVLAVLGSGIALLYAVLQQAFSANPRLNSPDNLNFGHFLGVLLVAVAVGVYHWRVLRSDAALRPAKNKPDVASVAAAIPVAVVSPATAPPIATAHGKRYVLSVMDASEDDVHQALANLPPAASYRLTSETEG
ncbi:MAG TPA: DUF5671 domain-containing protein [Clostridia bacterium]|nr:DUF5671 domain-containing protein [Clostridia bacterium]